jgi:hypothetical protein
MYKYRYIPSAIGFVCAVYDQNDSFLGTSPGFSKKDAKRRVQLKIGIKKLEPHHDKERKKTMNKGGHRTHEPRGSVMTGLQGKTGARTWRHTK